MGKIRATKPRWFLKETLLATLSRFAFVGGIATGTYIVVSNVLIFLHFLPAAVASVAAYIIGMVVSYGGQSRFTFRVERSDIHQPLRYVVMSALGIGISYFNVFAADSLFRVNAFWGTLATAIIVPIASFLLMKFWVFAPKAGLES